MIIDPDAPTDEDEDKASEDKESPEHEQRPINLPEIVLEPANLEPTDRSDPLPMDSRSIIPNSCESLAQETPHLVATKLNYVKIDPSLKSFSSD